MPDKIDGVSALRIESIGLNLPDAKSSFFPAPAGTYPLVCEPRSRALTRVVWPLLDECGWHVLPGCGGLLLSSRLGECSKRMVEPFVSVDARARSWVSEAFAEVGISSGSPGQLRSLCRCASCFSLPVAYVARVQ